MYCGSARVTRDEKHSYNTKGRYRTRSTCGVSEWELQDLRLPSRKVSVRQPRERERAELSLEHSFAYKFRVSHLGV